MESGQINPEFDKFYIQCPICRDDIPADGISALHCGHLFHFQCIKFHLERSRFCPICRFTTGLNGIIKRLYFDAKQDYCYNRSVVLLKKKKKFYGVLLQNALSIAELDKDVFELIQTLARKYDLVALEIKKLRQVSNGTGNEVAKKKMATSNDTMEGKFERLMDDIEEASQDVELERRNHCQQ